jgi:tRNA U55 pseudouridine synthase TruB
LFQYALEGALDTIQVPTIDVEIYSMDYLGVCTISRSELIEQVIKKINLLKTDPNDTRVGSDFRKDAIIEKWRALPDEPNQCIILKFKISVSSGTYIRTLAPLIAEKLGTCGLAYSIHRTRIDFYYRVHKEADGTVFL